MSDAGRDCPGIITGILVTGNLVINISSDNEATVREIAISDLTPEVGDAMGAAQRDVTLARRASLWLMAAAMILVVGFKSVPHLGLPWPWLGFPLVGLSLWVGRGDANRSWSRTLVLLAYTIVVLWLTRIDGDTGNEHILELALMLGIGILLIPALAAKYWLGEPLDYSWVRGRWSDKMWLWFPAGFVIAFTVLWAYFNILTPTLHHSWPLPLLVEPSVTEALWRLFWGCNFVGIWDELAFINFVFVLLCRHFSVREANFVQAIFFTSFLHEMAFVGWGPVFIYAFALIQGYTYDRTRSLIYIVILHLMIDTILFYLIANGWYPGWGWHP